MPADEFAPYAVNLTHSTTPVLIDSLDEMSLDGGQTIERQNADGFIGPRSATTLQIDSRLTVTTRAIEKVLGLLGATNVIPIGSAETYLTVEAHWRRMGVAAAQTTGHRKRVMNKGVIVPISITATQGGVATMQLIVVPEWDGTNAAWVASTVADSLPGTPTGGKEHFTLGQVNIDGVLFDRIQSVTINFNRSIVPIFGDGVEYPKKIVIDDDQPEVTIEARDISYMDAAGIDGAAVAGNDTNVYLRFVPTPGVPDANATATHAKLTINSGYTHVRSESGRRGTQSLSIYPINDGANPIIAYAVDQAIT